MRTELQEMGDIETSVSYFQHHRVSREGSLLDIGTRFGSFVHQIRSSGYSKVTGIDVDFKALAAGSEEYPDLRGCVLRYDGKVLPFANETFNAVTMFDVLEHVTQPGAYLREVQRILKPDGLLIFQTPI